jgi:hypothetical protein
MRKWWRAVDHGEEFYENLLSCTSGRRVYNRWVSTKKSARKKFKRPPRADVLGVRLNVREVAMMQAVVDVEGVSASELVRGWLRTAHDALGAQGMARAVSTRLKARGR